MAGRWRRLKRCTHANPSSRKLTATSFISPAPASTIPVLGADAFDPTGEFLGREGHRLFGDGGHWCGACSRSGAGRVRPQLQGVALDPHSAGREARAGGNRRQGRHPANLARYRDPSTRHPANPPVGPVAFKGRTPMQTYWKGWNGGSYRTYSSFKPLARCGHRRRKLATRADSLIGQ